MSEQFRLLHEPSKRPWSAFDELGFGRAIDSLLEEIRSLYLTDSIPWVIGYSGGKDSSACVQLVWMALDGLSPEARAKPVHIISTDTLVENPIVASWVTGCLDTMRATASTHGLPFSVHRLTPALKDSFWVNLIGKGYPAPRVKFRWCTDRLKIKPSNAFISDVVSANGEAILVLGTRKAESRSRRERMETLEKERIRDRLSPNASLPGSMVYSPIEDWSNDDVWMYLMQVPNPWGGNNKDLLTLYQGATEGGECPLVVDKSTPSCGSSRFGCWVCTMVEQDKSMQAMIQNDEEKEWMLPLLELRNALDIGDDRHLRDFRRMTGKVQLMGSEGRIRVIPGPYTQAAREEWLRRLLVAQSEVRRRGPLPDLELISLDELREIRRIWVLEKHELEDSLPRIYAACTRQLWPDGPISEVPFGEGEMELLRALCEGDENLYQLTRELLAVEKQHRTMASRRGLYDAIETTLSKHLFSDEADAIAGSAASYEARQAIRQLSLLQDSASKVMDMEERRETLRISSARVKELFDRAVGEGK